MTTPSGPARCAECKTFNGKHSPGCSVGFPATFEVEKLRAKVLAMRELGVTEADGIKLGPLPSPPKKEMTEEEWKEHQVKIAQRQHDIMFAHSGTRPKLRLAKAGPK